jgi:Bacterial protein of unknown function (DUF899)
MTGTDVVTYSRERPGMRAFVLEENIGYHTLFHLCPSGRRYKKRIGWSFPWVSSDGSDFSFDYNVSWTPEQLRAGKGTYNFQDWKVSVSDDQGS